MKKKFVDFVNSKGGKGVFFGSVALLVFGLACFIVGYGLIDGWSAVLAWFTSRWAIYVYVCIFLWAMVVLAIYHYSKNFKE